MEEVSGSGGGSKPDRAAAAAAAADGTWGIDSESDDDYGHLENDCEDPKSGSDDDYGHSDCEDPKSGSDDDSEYDCEFLMWNLIGEDNSDGLMKLLNIPKDGNHCSGIGQKDPHYNRAKLNHAFDISCHLNKLDCLKALLYCGFDWFAEKAAVGVDRLLQSACMSDSKDAAEVVIQYAKEKNVAVADNLLGAGDGFTPLHVAARSGSCNVIQLLLDEGADPCKQNAKRKLPCDCAQPGTKARKLLVDAVLNKVRS